MRYPCTHLGETLGALPLEKPRDSDHAAHAREREFFINNLLVQIFFIIVMIRWTGLAPWEFEIHLAGSLTSTFLALALPEPLHLLQPAHRD